MLISRWDQSASLLSDLCQAHKSSFKKFITFSCPGSDNFDMIIKAIVHKAEEGGFWAEVPALPGCLTQGETKEEIQQNLLEAIELWFEAGEVAEESESGSQVLEIAI